MKLSFEEWWYNRIFKEYSKPRKETQELYWLYKTLKRLKILLEITDDINLVKNSIVILVNLLGDDPLDKQEKLGKDVKDLPLRERENIKTLLKETVILKRIEEN